jgi:hypothetical protein
VQDADERDTRHTYERCSTVLTRRSAAWSVIELCWSSTSQSQCGLTPQYSDLEALQEELAERGFTVLGFPCNQFGDQEPGTAEEIAAFCSTNYGVTFPLSSKIEVNGPGPAIPSIRR